MTTLLLLYDVAMPAALMSLVWWAMVLRRQRDEARREVAQSRTGGQACPGKDCWHRGYAATTAGCDCHCAACLPVAESAP